MKLFKSASVILLLLTGILGIAYPLLVYGLGQLFFHEEAEGSLVRKGSVVIGSRLIGQNFQREGYFHPRPSAAGEQGYDAASSSGSNLGPTSQKLADAIVHRMEAYRSSNGLKSTDPLPIDALTASGSGLDPHISVENAKLQVPRIAKSRKISLKTLYDLIEDNQENSLLGCLETPYVNVLEINLALDELIK